MTTKEAIKEVEARGVKVSYWKVRALVENGTVDRPRMNSSLQWDWSPANVRQLIEAVVPKMETANR